MTDKISLNNPKVTVYIRHNPRARRMTLRVSNRDGRVALSVPPGTARAQIEKFLWQQSAWLGRHCRDDGGPLLDFGQKIHLNGALYELRHGGGRFAHLEGACIILPGDPNKIGGQLRALFKHMARDQLVPIAQGCAAKLGRSISGFSFRDPHTRWGSCSSQGRIMLSWRLVMAPHDVQAYVAIHEVCHLVEMNHSARFWALVEQQMPDYQSPQQWLRQHGRDLQRYPL